MESIEYHIHMLESTRGGLWGTAHVPLAIPRDEDVYRVVDVRHLSQKRDHMTAGRQRHVVFRRGSPSQHRNPYLGETCHSGIISLGETVSHNGCENRLTPSR